MHRKSDKLALVLTSLLLTVAGQQALALVEVEPNIPLSLSTVPVPEPENLSEFVKDKKVAIALGKALFWDAQVGSDGLACASCHFHAGADNRFKNQISPGLKNMNGAPVTETFNDVASNTDPSRRSGGPNYTLKMADFPFHQLLDPSDRNSPVLFDSDDVVSSQGAFSAHFDELLRGRRKREACTAKPSIFNVGGINVRQSEPRNTPTVINAVYNFRNFWDGRANNIFNGLDPFGSHRPYNPDDAINIRVNDPFVGLMPVQIQIADASLASQAVGPALSDLEMSCAGRGFLDVGRKMLRVHPLAGQKVDRTDSVLGTYTDGNGLKPRHTYATLIKSAFADKYWNSRSLINGYTQMENNFSLFWGLAIQMYEATLVSDQSPYDKYRQNPAANPLSDQQLRGLAVFAGKGRCLVCHVGPEFTGASKTHVTEGFVERMLMGAGSIALYDTGFYNLGVRPTIEDRGAGAKDPYGNPLNFTRQAKALADSWSNDVWLPLDQIVVSDSNFLHRTGMPIDPAERDAVDGSFKTPSLRNVELTGPYFHTGGYATLEQVVEFYNRGGNRLDTGFNADNSGFGDNPSNLAADLAGHIDPLEQETVSQTLDLTPEDMSDLVAFLKSLTDERVRWEQAPFDHPELPLPNGAIGNQKRVRVGDKDATKARDSMFKLPAIGAAGRAAKRIGPLMPFDAALR